MSSRLTAHSSQRPEDALETLAEQLRAEDSVISPHVVNSEEEPVLGMLAAAGPRASGSPGEYALVVEAVREGYLLHYGLPRLLEGHDSDLALLAGDYLYALGLSRLGQLGDLEAVRELSDLISLCAQVHAEAGEDGAGATSVSAPLWLASVTAIAAGFGDAHERGKASLREGRGVNGLAEGARETARREGISDALERAADSIGFHNSDWP